MKNVFNFEIPAYTTGSEVEKYIFNIADNQTVKARGTAIVYEEARQVLRKERFAYFKNRLFGKLGKPILYHSDKDLLKLVDSKEEKEMLTNLLKGLSDKGKTELLGILKENPEALVNINHS